MDIHELTPSPYLSQNEIDAAKSVQLDQYNAQEQTHIVWPATFALARAYLDQLERNGGLSASRISAVRSELSNAERRAAASARRCSRRRPRRSPAILPARATEGRVTLLEKAVMDLSKAR